ncbi:MAG: hypothetical protein ABJN36_00050 [Cyclobacteriaceae bacterium]
MRYSIFIIVIASVLCTSCFEEQDFAGVAKEVQYLAVSEDGATVLEGTDSEVTIDFIYSGVSPKSDVAIPVSLVTDETTAVENVDYTLDATLGSMTIAAGSFKTSLNVTILDNDEAVGPRSLVFALAESASVPTGFLGAEEGRTFTLTINEDDAITFGYTSFEEPTAGLVNNYPSQDGVEQVNVEGENSVDYVSTGGEMGFNTSYVAGQEGGADSGLLFGVSKFTSDTEWGYDLGSFTDGVQAYSTSDADGLAEIVFDELTIPGEIGLLQISLDLWFSDSSWEEDDEIDLIWRTTDGDELILSLRSDGASMTNSSDGSGDVIVDQWTSFVAEVSSIKTGSLVIQIGTDSGSEIAFIDNIVIKGL